MLLLLKFQDQIYFKKSIKHEQIRSLPNEINNIFLLVFHCHELKFKCQSIRQRVNEFGDGYNWSILINPIEVD